MRVLVSRENLSYIEKFQRRIWFRYRMSFFIPAANRGSFAVAIVAYVSSRPSCEKNVP